MQAHSSSPCSSLHRVRRNTMHQYSDNSTGGVSCGVSLSHEDKTSLLHKSAQAAGGVAESSDSASSKKREPESDVKNGE